MVSELLSADWQVHGLVRCLSSDAGLNSKAKYSNWGEVEWERLLAPDVTIFHLAGRADVRSSLRDPFNDAKKSLVCTLRVLDEARKAKSTVVFASTGAVYASDSGTACHEASALQARSPYAAEKLAVEAYMQAYSHSFGTPTAIARIFSVYGPGQRGRVINDFVEKLKTSPNRLKVRGSGNQLRDYIHVEDVARALICIAERGNSGEIYNIGTGVGTTIREIANFVAHYLGINQLAVEPDGNDTPGEPQSMIADIRKLTALGFHPQKQFEKEVGAVIQSIIHSRSKGFDK